MDAKDYAIDNLIVKCSEKMNESGYSQGCISTHVVRWKLHLKPFLVKKRHKCFMIQNWGGDSLWKCFRPCPQPLSEDSSGVSALLTHS